MMKRTCFTTFLSLIALFAIVFSLASCAKKGEYPEIKSSKEEATVVATLGGHEVRYELYRAFFSAMYSGKTEGMTEEEKEVLYRGFCQLNEFFIESINDTLDHHKG